MTVTIGVTPLRIGEQAGACPFSTRAKDKRLPILPPNADRLLQQAFTGANPVIVAGKKLDLPPSAASFLAKKLHHIGGRVNLDRA